MDGRIDSMNTFSRVLFFVVPICLLAAVSFYYHPSLEITVVGALLSTLLVALVSWSATRFGKGPSAILKLAAISLVSSFMLIQAFDIAYIFLAVPMGGRFAFLPELLAFALIVGVCAFLLARAFSRPKK